MTDTQAEQQRKSRERRMAELIERHAEALETCRAYPYAVLAEENRRNIEAELNALMGF